MITREFQGNEMPMLGLGTMRLPILEDKSIDKVATKEMVDYAMAHGIRYYDTAYPYHSGQSELVVGECLKEYPRESFYLADKYPGHQPMEQYIPSEIFELQLKKCGVDYFDFYLLHNVYEHDMDVYTGEKWNIIPYFVKQKEEGRIKHLGFSCHARTEGLRSFLDFCKEKGYVMEFCQIQLNFLDWTLQEAEEKVKILNEYNIPIWVMEPVRGGKLSAKAKEAFRFLMDVPGVTVVLSGMSNMDQLRENIETFNEENPLSAEEKSEVFDYAERLKQAVPCTACRYCTDGCPMELNIPILISTYNDMKLGGGFTPVMYLEKLPEEKRPSACIGCGACQAVCPQNIAIPEILKDLADRYDKAVKWSDVCREREEAAKNLK